MANPNVKNNGGPVIGNIQLVPIVWGNGWPYAAGSPLPAQMLAFLQFFLGPNSPNMAMLHEYSTASTQILPGSVVGNQILTAPGNPPNALPDSQIQSTLKGWIANQNGQTPGFPQPGANTVYMILLPQSVIVSFQGKVNCGGFGGYHFSTGNVTYVVVPCCSSPGTAFAAVLNGLTPICSHELSEVITDPGGGSGWLDANTNPRDEIGDVCQGTGYPQLNAPIGTVSAGGGQSWKVQAIWSQSQNNCVFGPPGKLSSIALTAVLYGGQPATGSVTLTEPVPAFPAGGSTVTLSSNNPALTFTPPTVTIPPGKATAPIAATTTGVLDSVVVTVSAKLGAQIVQQELTILSPAIKTFDYAPASAQGYQYPPNAPKGTLALNVAAPAGGLIVSVVSGETLLVVPEPDEIPIAAGKVSPSVPFYLQVNPAGAQTPVTLTASISGSSVPFTFNVLAGGPPNIVVKSLTISPSTVIGGATTFGHFTLAAAVGPSGGSIAVLSSDTSVATVPATVHLSAGAVGGQFAITSKALQQPTPLAHCTITAVGSGQAAHALLTVKS